MSLTSEELVAMGGPQATSGEWDIATADARQVAEESTVVRIALTLGIAGHQLLYLSQKILHDELVGGWEMPRKDCVNFTLNLSAREKAAQSATPLRLLEMLVESIVPLVDSISRMNAEVPSVASGPEAVFGASDGDAAGLEAVAQPTSGEPDVEGSGEDCGGPGEEGDGAGGGSSDVASGGVGAGSSADQ